MADFVKVPEDSFKAAIRTLLNAAPMPAGKIKTKRTRAADAHKPGPKAKKLAQKEPS